MARTIGAGAIARRAAEQAAVQSYTRCRIPIDEELAHSIKPTREVLAKVPGHDNSIVGRNIDDLEEVLLVLNWVDIISLNTFIASPEYAAYFETLGIEEPTRFHAFFILNPTMRRLPLCGKMTTYTMTFGHPVNLETHNRVNQATGLSFPHGFHSFNTHSGWVSKPQVFPVGQLVDTGVIVQPWPQAAADIQDTTSKDPEKRTRWKQRVDLIAPFDIEEVTWDMKNSLSDLAERMGVLS